MLKKLSFIALMGIAAAVVSAKKTETSVVRQVDGLNVAVDGPEVQYSSEKPWDELEIRVYPGSDGSFTLYEDEGDNYNYEKGKYSEIQFSWNEANRTLSIAPRKGGFKGMIQSRKFHVVLVDGNSGVGDRPMQPTKTVEYDGSAVAVRL